MEKRKKWNALRTALLTAAAVMLVMSAVMGSAWAYFTTYTSAKGGVTLHMGHEETVEEDFSGWQKTLNITSTADSKRVYVRARGFCADYDLSYSDSQNWVRNGDWMYYTKILEPGTSLDSNTKDKDPEDALIVKISGVPTENVSDGDTFNVIVVYETTEVQYDASGNEIAPQNADWNRAVDTTRTTTTLD